ncbi:transforming protein E7 [Human papillomavirus 121]|uniref:Protein E7 n=1 Tax=Human papillomavirus 121 TaxID=915429 RepID=D7P174_9PAPI|nr:transforming protein E7 [Human papillomavirus 121]ADH29806.1 transforming protein E7 [Human papillomavirus 121]
MIGPESKVGDIELQLEELVMPADLLSDEVLSPDEDEEEELDEQPYRIDSVCRVCKTSIRFYVSASDQGIRGLQQLLLSQLSFICTRCTRTSFRQNGRQ